MIKNKANISTWYRVTITSLARPLAIRPDTIVLSGANGNKYSNSLKLIVRNLHILMVWYRLSNTFILFFTKVILLYQGAIIKLHLTKTISTRFNTMIIWA